MLNIDKKVSEAHAALSLVSMHDLLFQIAQGCPSWPTI